MTKYVEDVFVTEGLPTSTFVNPPNFAEVFVDVRSRTKPIIIEGQAGTGKITTVKKILEELNRPDYVYLTARNPADLVRIASLSNDPAPGVFIIDDFHRLGGDVSTRIADIAKRAAEEGVESGLPKFVIIGINQVGSDLIQLVPDLAKRIGVHKIAKGDSQTIGNLIDSGAKELNIRFVNKDAIIQEADGDYWLTQMLCRTACTASNVLQTVESATPKDIAVEIGVLRTKATEKLSTPYGHAVREFCRGRRFRPSNEPYFKLLRKVASLRQSVVDLTKLANQDAEVRGSINNLKDYRLSNLIDSKETVKKYFYYNSDTKSFAIEDPALLYYLRHLNWEQLRDECGFRSLDREYEFDVAISFAGENRDLARYISEYLEQLDVKVFFDENYEANYLGKTWSKEFARIFGEQSRFVISLLDEHYATKIWPTFEREVFLPRLANGEVIPIYLDDTLFVGIPRDTIGVMFSQYNIYKAWQDEAEKKIIFPIIDRIG